MMESEDYETMYRVLERSKVLNDLIQEMVPDMPLTPVALEEIESYRVRRYAEECFYRETLTAPDLELYDSYEAKHPAGMLAALAAGANPNLPICWACASSSKGEAPASSKSSAPSAQPQRTASEANGAHSQQIGKFGLAPAARAASIPAGCFAS